MTELSFLLSLLLDHKLTKEVQVLIKERIKEIEARPQGIQSGVALAQLSRSPNIPPHLIGQAPSTIANFMKEGLLTPELIETGETPITPPVVTSPVVAQALAERQKIIRGAKHAGPLAGKPEEGRTSPRKF